MSRCTVVYDACVPYQAPLRSLLMYLALTDMFRVKWTDAIHEEWMRNVRKDYPDMNAHVRDCLVTDYEDLIGALTLPDPDDRHVLAAAIRAGAGVVVTTNLADFPKETLTKYGIEAQHPVEFIMHLLDLAPNLVCSAAKKQRESLKNPPLTVVQYLESLERQGLTQTVSALRQFAELI